MAKAAAGGGMGNGVVNNCDMSKERNFVAIISFYLLSNTNKNRLALQRKRPGLIMIFHGIL